MRRMRRSVPIRRSILGNIVTLIVVLGAAIILTTVLGAQEAVRSLSASLIARCIDETEAKLAQFFSPVTGGLQVARSWGEEGLLDLDRPERINEIVMPIMRRYPQVSSAFVADAGGREHMLLRADDGWRLRRLGFGEPAGTARVWEWTDGGPDPTETLEEIDYDPRGRPWFAGAVARRGEPSDADGDPTIHWTEPYTFFTTREPGITASVAFDVPGSPSVEHVIGFDVALDDISRFTYHLQPSKDGFAFALFSDGKMIGLPRLPMFADRQARRRALLKSPDEVPILRDATGAYLQRPQAERGAFRLVSGGRPWWAGGRAFELGGGRVLLVVISLPESDIIGHLARIRLWIIVITMGVLVAAVWRAFVIAGRFSRPIEALVAQADRIRKGDLEPGAPVKSRVREVRQLAGAQDRMRVGLQALMKLERDLQVARQIQEETFPARLPALRGFEIDAWSEPAEETGGDTYDVIGYRRRADRIVLSADRAQRAVLLLADATGHGIGPALSVTQVRAMLRMAVRTGENLASIIHQLNQQLCADLPDGRFITTWIAELNSRNRAFTAFSAGQGPILRFNAERNAVDVLDADTLPLGVDVDLEIDVAKPEPMPTGDIVAVISDGIYEAADASGAQFGTGRVVDIITEHHQSSPAEIIKAVREAVENFTGAAPAADDRTGIIIKAV